MKRFIRFILRFILLPTLLIAAIPTAMLIRNGYEVYASALATLSRRWPNGSKQNRILYQWKSFHRSTWMQ